MGVLERRRPVGPDEIRDRADWIRLETIRLVEVAKSGHYSSVFSCAEILATLYYHTLRLDPSDPLWPDRDRLVLGKGHVAIGQYPILADLGYFPVEWLDSYTRLGSALGDHPDMNKVPGVDFSSGSIGHNLSVAVGMALGGRMSGRDFVTWALLGDGELNEGQVWEAAMSASHFGLNRLVAVVDANGMGLDGPIEEVMSVEPIAGRFSAFGWETVELDGHDAGALIDAFDQVHDARGPVLIVARTKKGKGVEFMEISPHWHLGYLGPADRATAVAEITNRRAR